MATREQVRRQFFSQSELKLEFLAIFFCDFFSSRNTCVRMATHAIFAARLRRNNLKKKSHHLRKQKIARVATA